MKKTLIILVLLFSSSVFADYIIFDSKTNESTGYLEQSILDKYEASLTIESSHEYKDLQLIIRSQQDNKDGMVLVSLVIEPHNWDIKKSNKASLFLDDEKIKTHYIIMIGPLFWGNKVLQEMNFFYSHKNFKKIVESKKFKIVVEDFIAIIDLTKLPLSKLNLQK